MKNLKRDYYIPSNGIKETYEDVKCDVYKYETIGSPCVSIFSGKRVKPVVLYRFETEEKRSIFIEKFIQKERIFWEKREEEKRILKDKELKEISELKVGDIFVSSWGWEQTNIDAYQLIELKNKTGTFREIALKSLSQTSWGSDICAPIKDDFLENSKPFKKILKGNYIRLSSFQHARKIVDKDRTFHRSWYA